MRVWQNHYIEKIGCFLQRSIGHLRQYHANSSIKTYLSLISRNEIGLHSLVTFNTKDQHIAYNFKPLYAFLKTLIKPRATSLFPNLRETSMGGSRRAHFKNRLPTPLTHRVTSGMRVQQSPVIFPIATPPSV